jgi:hypothetical protein
MIWRTCFFLWVGIGGVYVKIDAGDFELEAEVPKKMVENSDKRLCEKREY